ncbi:thioredoxin [Desulfuromonas versatilis]|uniref:Thioredoxin n=1 Tax=Desulfuromonas versatilis TaxID=2802975 RepID=A0ABN6E2H9_9BACT|nr:thioredoxin domain-containing protein [Desulfuromonas versatilis]BCR05734.1 thioredoxin [Desulfuromonas versatilis]
MTSRPTREDQVARLSRIDKAQLPADGGELFNRLIFEKSPYLLQHAENPVDWHPWGEEAFARAQAEDKAVFLSIGYSTCHWCHVMEHESFEDEEVAAVLNRNFISIKVDREERPDIDNAYMSVCQMMTGSGGWPLNLVLTPERRPFFAATYIPKTSRGGMVGMIQLMRKIAELWRADRPRLETTGQEVGRALQRLEQEAHDRQPLSDLPLRKGFNDFLDSFDRQHAGFGSAPKFPTPHNLALLLRIGQRFGRPQAADMALQTLQAMRLGGIFDQVGFGIHRYSVDARWLVPHFEKMLYDQALVASAALDGFQVGGDGFHAQTAREILEYLLRDLRDLEGGFYCGEDADSEGAEGTFYLWTPEQVEQVLGADLAKVFCRSYDITDQGNFEGKNIPHLEQDVGALADRVGVDPAHLADLLGEARQKLFAAREKRIRPHRDDKVLTGWNGLAIAALARAGALLGEPRFIAAAQAAADFVLTRLRGSDGRLLRRWRLGEAAIPGFLEDYAFFVWGLIELHQATFVTERLAQALELNGEMERLFADGQGGFFDTGSDAEFVLSRGRSIHDGAIPSAGSVAALNLLRLGRLTGDLSLEERGQQLLSLRFGQMAAHPQAYSQALIALDFALGPAIQVVLVSGSDGSPPEELLKELRRRLLPTAVVLLTHPGDRELESLAPLVAGKQPVKGRAAAYVCIDRACREPVTTGEELAALLDALRADGDG